jgi:hypothetical protein
VRERAVSIVADAKSLYKFTFRLAAGGGGLLTDV